MAPTLLALIVRLLTPSAFAAIPVPVAGDPWCPFTCKAGSESPGALIELLREALGKDYEVRYEEVAWARAVADSRTGKYAAIVGALKSDAPDFIYPRSSSVSQKSCFYVRPDSSWRYKGIPSLKGKTLGVVKDYTYGEPLDTYLKGLPASDESVEFLTGTETANRLIKKLEASRIEVFVEDQSVIQYSLKLMNHSFKPSRAGCLEPQPLYIAFSPADPARAKKLIAELEKGLEKLKASGRIRDIFKKYGIKD